MDETNAEPSSSPNHTHLDWRSESVFAGHADLHRADNTADSNNLHKPPHGQGDIVCVEHSNQFTQSQSSLGTKDQVRHGVNQ